MAVLIEVSGGTSEGFLIDEKEIRRIIDIVIEKLAYQDDLRFRLKYKLANGAILEPDKIDNLFNEENIGTKKIISIGLYWFGDAEEERGEIEFINLHHDEDAGKSIRYKFIGTNRDALFVLSSELDERIKKVSVIKLKKQYIQLVVLIIMLIASWVPIVLMDEPAKYKSIADSFLMRDNITPRNIIEFMKETKSSVPAFIQFYPVVMVFFCGFLSCIWIYSQQVIPSIQFFDRGK
ncbi:hypothetical protein [Afifella marina]|uniref:Uncharacterized protein n=1 Tax=Afifella marina DSM 2698 TaxID=1120955 RepID=A0A1G5MJY2_AFIMA|nr:hypothetical protein [Afifella marina]SCZ24878.1 hypothetical protein SAMN03080610_00727 [Afifella marina DSM 2698]